MWHRRTHLAPLVLVLASAAALPVAAQVTVTTLAEGDQPVKSTTNVRVSRFADFTESDLLRLGDEMAEGDLLTALDPSVRLELTCPRGSLLHFSDGFRVLIQGSESADCAAAFLAGDLDVLTDTDTSVGVGGRTLGTEGTRYAVELRGGRGRAEPWIWVFEGKVGVSGEGPAASVTQGRMAVYGEPRSRPVEDAISARETERWAGRYADFDVIKAKLAGVDLSPQQEASTRVELTRLYTDVLTKPDDEKARVQLARVQLDHRVDVEAIHNLKRAGIVDDKTLEELEIDPGALRRGDPRVRERLDPLIREPDSSSYLGITNAPNITNGPGLIGDPEMTNVPNLPPNEALPDTLADWLAAKAFDKVIETVDAKRRSGTATAHDYCSAAQAYAETGEDGKAGGAARRAFALVREGEGLTAAELSICRDIAVKFPG